MVKTKTKTVFCPRCGKKYVLKATERKYGEYVSITPRPHLFSGKRVDCANCQTIFYPPINYAYHREKLILS